MRIVIAEDLVLLRDGLARALTAYGETVVAEVGDAGSLIEAVAREHPDIAIIDVRMPPAFRDEGARAARVLRERFPGLGTLILSHTVDPQLALELGAARPSGFGYLLKDRVLDIDEFVASARTVGAGGTVIDPVVIEHGMSRRALPLESLSAREREVLAELARGRSNAAIAASLFISERTVDAHLRAIFVRLDLPQSVEANRRVQAALAWLQAEPDQVGQPR